MDCDESKYDQISCDGAVYGQISCDKVNIFSENFDIGYVLKQLENQSDQKKHLLCDININILNSQGDKNSMDIYEKNLINKQKKIIINTKINYKKLNNINYVKYYLPYCIQPKTNNTNLCLSKNIYQKNIKQNILRELHIKKSITKYRINHFIKKYTGKFKKKDILYQHISRLYNEKSRVEIFIKNKKSCKINYDKVIGDIVFFDHKINVMLENATLNKGSNKQTVPWMFIQSRSVIFFKRHT